MGRFENSDEGSQRECNSGSFQQHSLYSVTEMEKPGASLCYRNNSVCGIKIYASKATKAFDLIYVDGKEGSWDVHMCIRVCVCVCMYDFVPILLCSVSLDCLLDSCISEVFLLLESQVPWLSLCFLILSWTSAIFATYSAST